jgi:heat shock transcription factor
MDGAPAGGGGGGPAPFLLKTYDMVDDSGTDEIVSWSSNRTSFVVWNPPEFARLLLPTYFKHNNFSSFIRQLNTYGFRKIDPEKWEFANEEFIKDQKHLLKNIHRRKPIHSHSNNPQGSTSVDPERSSFEEEIDKLTREKSTLETNLLRSKQQQPITKIHLEQLANQILSMEQRQERLLTNLDKSIQDPHFMEHLASKLESMDFSTYNKKRRLPSQEDHSFGNIYQQDLSNKLALELSSHNNSTQSSNEDCRVELSDTSNEDIEGHLNLTLASSPLLVNKSQPSSTVAKIQPEPPEKVNPPQPARVNDVFWEQFLTEKPGVSETEETSSTFRANNYEDQQQEDPQNYSKNNMDQLSL